MKMGIIPANAKLTPRPQEIPAWDSLNADQKKLYARMMEVYAAALAYADHQMGRILDAVEDLGQLDNTLVIYIQGDNGASAEGGFNGLLNEMTFFNGIPEDFKEVLKRMDELGSATTFNHYPIGWAHAMNTPFQWTKQVASHFGGTRNGLVMSWPARIKDKGGIRTQFHHVIDIAPTILEAVGVQSPAVLNGVPQKPIEGVSMAYTFDDANAPSRVGHSTSRWPPTGPSTTTAGWPAPLLPSPHGPVSGSRSTSMNTSGNCIACRRISPRPSTSPRRSRRNSASFRTCFGSKPRSTTCYRSTTGVWNDWT